MSGAAAPLPDSATPEAMDGATPPPAHVSEALASATSSEGIVLQLYYISAPASPPLLWPVLKQRSPV